ncbi:MAG: DUF2333 family protein [Gammaproteobacteria bacterium]
MTYPYSNPLTPTLSLWEREFLNFKYLASFMLARLFGRNTTESETYEDHFSLAGRIAVVLVSVTAIVLLGLSYYWDVDTAFFDPPRFDVREATLARVAEDPKKLVSGAVTSATLIEVASFLIDKPGGYVANDITPPGLLMDNTPSWEFGVVVQLRDLTRVLRNDFSRSQTQSTEDADLSRADPDFHNDTDAWLFPSFEGQAKAGVVALERYFSRLTNVKPAAARFYARADNLVAYLSLVAQRLGDHSQRLSASVGKAAVPITSANPAAAEDASLFAAPSVKTPWMDLDDVFYEARGAAWALLHFLRAIEIDFESVLNKKNALASVRQIIRELERTQDALMSPMVLTGDGFAIFANHSLVMASYISRANAATIDLIKLLQQG